MARLKFAAEHWLASIAVIISIVAIVQTRMQLNDSRNHDRLSMMPVLDAWRDRASNTSHPGIYVHNGGSGPAIITRVKIHLAGGMFDRWETALASSHLNIDHIKYRNIVGTSALSPSETMYLLEAIEGVDHYDAMEVATTIRKEKIAICVTYTSIYGEEFTKFSPEMPQEQCIPEGEGS